MLTRHVPHFRNYWCSATTVTIVRVVGGRRRSSVWWWSVRGRRHYTFCLCLCFVVTLVTDTTTITDPRHSESVGTVDGVTTTISCRTCAQWDTPSSLRDVALPPCDVRYRLKRAYAHRRRNAALHVGQQPCIVVSASYSGHDHGRLWVRDQHTRWPSLLLCKCSLARRIVIVDELWPLPSASTRMFFGHPRSYLTIIGSRIASLPRRLDTVSSPSYVLSFIYQVFCLSRV